MPLTEFIVSEFWLILLIVSMLLCKQYRISALLILTIKIVNGIVLPPFLIIMVVISILLDIQKKSEVFINKQKLIKKSKM